MIAVIAIFAVSAAIWSVLLIRKTGLVGGCVATILMGSCLGYHFLRVDMGPIGITSDRLFLGFLFAMCGLHVWLGDAVRPHWTIRDGILFAFVAILLGNASWVYVQTGDTAGLAKVAFFFVLPAMLYVISRCAPIGELTIQHALLTFALFSVYLAVTGTAEKLGFYHLVFPSYIATSEFVEFFGRARGPFLNPTANGLYMTFGICGLILLWRRTPHSLRMPCLACVGLIGFGIYCTLTRSVWLGAGLAVVITIAASVPRRWSVAFICTSAIVSVLFVGMQWENLVAFKRDRYVSVESMESSAQLRPVLAKVAYDMFLDKPFVGFGIGRYSHHCKDYLNDGSTGLRLEKVQGYVQHNIFLAILVEAGLLGLVPFVLLLLIWLKSGCTMIRMSEAHSPTWILGVVFCSLLIAFVINGLFHDLLIVQMVNHLIFLVAGLGQSMLGQSRIASRARPAQIRQWQAA